MADVGGSFHCMPKQRNIFSPVYTDIACGQWVRVRATYRSENIVLRQGDVGKVIRRINAGQEYEVEFNFYGSIYKLVLPAFYLDKD
jgi:hypothetical protein